MFVIKMIVDNLFAAEVLTIQGVPKVTEPKF